MKEWKIEHCSERPLELQVIAPGIYMQRRNIRQVEHEATEGMEAYTDWECECREITFEEYHQSIVDETLANHTASIDYIAMMTDIDLEEV